MTPLESKHPSDDDIDYEGFLSAPQADPWRLRHLFLLIIGVAVLLWLVRVTESFPATLVIVIFFVIVIAVGNLWARRRAAKAESLLAIMAIAAEKGMPLAPAIAAIATQYRGRPRRRLLGLATTLKSGKSLSESFAIVSKLLPKDATLLARAGEEAGVLPKAFRHAAEARGSYYPIVSDAVARMMYVFYVLIFMQVIVGFVVYFFMPKFEAIFRDFGLALPSATIVVIEVSHLVVRYSPITFLLFLCEILLLLFLPVTALGLLDFEIPWINRLFRRRHSALIMRALALFVDAGRPIEQGLECLVRNYPTTWVRRRLARVNEEVRNGNDWCVALWRQGLISSAAGGLLASARETGNLAWAMREFANTSDRRSIVRLQAAIQLIFPLVIFLLGVLVLFVTVAYFSPLVVLIERLS